MKPLRLFLALPLPEGYQQAMAGLARELLSALGPSLPRITWTRPGNWHLTLKFLGDVDPGQVDSLTGALAGLRMPPFPFQAGGAGFFPPPRQDRAPRPRVLWVGLAKGARETTALARNVEDALHPLGYARENRPFSPHLTLGRIRDGARGRGRGKEKAPDPELWNQVMRTIRRVEWPETEMEHFVLYRSVLGPEGPDYSVVERW